MRGGDYRPPAASGLPPPVRGEVWGEGLRAGLSLGGRVLAEHHEHRDQHQREDGRSKVADGALRKREADHGRAHQVDASEQQREAEPSRSKAKLPAQTAWTDRQDAGHQNHDQNKTEQESAHSRQSKERARRSPTDLRRPCGPSVLLRPPLLAYASTDARAPVLGRSTGVPVTQLREGPLATEYLAGASGHTLLRTLYSGRP